MTSFTDDGQVGGFGEVPNGSAHGFIGNIAIPFDLASVLASLKDLSTAGGKNSTVNFITVDGVAGGRTYIDPADTMYRACLWTPPSYLIKILDTPPDSNSVAFAANGLVPANEVPPVTNADQNAVGSAIVTLDTPNASFWDADGKLSHFNFPELSTSLGVKSAAVATNDFGWTVINANSNGRKLAYVYAEGAGLIPLIAQPGENVRAFSINIEGDVAGQVGKDAAVWVPENSPASDPAQLDLSNVKYRLYLPNLPGSVTSAAISINDPEDIVLSGKDAAGNQLFGVVEDGTFTPFQANTVTGLPAGARFAVAPVFDPVGGSSTDASGRRGVMPVNNLGQFAGTLLLPGGGTAGFVLQRPSGSLTDAQMQGTVKEFDDLISYINSHLPDVLGATPTAGRARRVLRNRLIRHLNRARQKAAAKNKTQTISLLNSVNLLAERFGFPAVTDSASRTITNLGGRPRRRIKF